MKGFNSKTWVFGVITTVLLIAIIMPSVPIASSETIDWCETVMSGLDCTLCSNIGFKIDEGTWNNILVIPVAKDCSLGVGVIVTGNIQVVSGAQFSTNGATVLGNIISDGASKISVTGAIVNGNIQIENSKASSSVSINNNEVDGNVVFKNNEVKSEIYFNGNRSIQQNAFRRMDKKIQRR